MRFFIDDVIFEVSEEELEYRYLDEGTEANIYRFEDEVFKIYKNDRSLKSKINLDTAKYLKKIKTKRILLPKKLIFDTEGNFCGYTLPYLDNCQKAIIKRKKMSDIIEELKLIEQDLITLKENSVDLEDFTLDNFIINTGLYIIDPGSYEISSDNKKFIETVNRHKYIEFMVNEVFPLAVRLNKEEKRKLMNYIAGEYITEIFNHDYEENDTLKKYIKRIVK